MITLAAKFGFSRPGFIDILHRYYPEIGVKFIGERYEDLVWENTDDKLMATEEHLNSLKLKLSKEMCIFAITTESNYLQSEAIKKHTESNDELQHTVYDLKFKVATTYVKAIMDNQGNPVGVPVPPMIQKECDATGEPPHLLAGYIVQNYEQANEELLTYIGTLEGYRRTYKRSVLEKADLDSLYDMEWAVWPTFKSEVSSSVDE